MYRTSQQIEFGMALLDVIFPECSRFQLPNQTVEGRTVHGLHLRGGASGGERRGVLLVGGTHARELMNPDLLLELAAELLVAYDDGTGITYGGRSWTATQVRLIMEVLDVYIVPNSNPDGREHALNTFAMWRKNRRDNPETTCDGVDLNRNLDVLWGVTEGPFVSCNPCSDAYCGPSAFSEPETANVKWALDTRRVDCFADVHSFSELVLYPWGHALTQTTDPSQRFTSLPSGTCAPIADRDYSEYMSPADLQRYETVSQRVVEAIKDVRGRVYTPQPGIDLYATTGTHSDYAYARHIADPSLRKTYGFTFETGPNLGPGQAEESFQPADPEPIKEEARSGLVALLLQCVCAIDLIGTRFLGEAEGMGTGMRRLREEALGRTEAGRAWMGLFERHQSELAAIVLENPELGERAARLVEAADLLLRGERDRVDDDDVTLATRLVEQVRGREISDGLRRDLAAVERQLERAAGRGRDELVEDLLTRGPRREEPRNKSR